LTEKKPISAVEITAERTIRPNRIAISMKFQMLGTTDQTGQLRRLEEPGVLLPS
jgi:hypothetical protein